MGLFGPYEHKRRGNKKDLFYLHSKERGKATLYFFSKNPVGALGSIPKGFEVMENRKSGLPYLKKKKQKKEIKPAEKK